MVSKKKEPIYRLHKRSGQAVVTLTDRRSGRRRDVYLGKHDSVESHERYVKAIGAWRVAGCIVDGAPDIPKPVSDALARQTVASVMLAFWRMVQKRYGINDGDKRIPSNPSKIQQAVKRCRSTAGLVLAHEFGPAELEAVRDKMIAEGLTRGYINTLTSIIKRAFKWAVRRGMIPASVYAGLQTVDGLTYGEQGVPEGGEPEPVPGGDVDAILPFLTPQAAAIVNLMRYTGMRPGEAVQMSASMLDVSKTTWWYSPERHKTKHRGKKREIPLGPQARQVIAPFMVGRPLTAPLFSPADAERWVREQRSAARTTPLSHGNKAGTNRKDDPKRKPGEAYTVASVRRAIERACEKAGVPVWTPKQCRNLAATIIRDEFGPEYVVIMLGHSGPGLVELYAKRNRDKAAAIAEKIG